MSLADITNAAQFNVACELLLRIHEADESDSVYRDIRDFLLEHGYLED